VGSGIQTKGGRGSLFDDCISALDAVDEKTYNNKYLRIGAWILVWWCR
jgi:hypothetical protein